MEELVKRLRELHPEEFGDAWDFAFACQQAMHEAAAAIEELQVDKAALNGTVTNLLEKIKDLGKPRWIPVTERLPEEHVFVLIRQDDDRMMVAERVDGDWWYRYFAYDVDRWDEDEQGTITHWQPLPEPPKEE